MCGQAKPFPWQCWGEESGGGWRGSLPGEGNPAGADNRVLCSPDESTCPSVGSRPGAPYGGDLPLAAAVPSRHGASLAGDAAPGTERSPGAEPCRMGPCEPCLCPSPVQPGNATTEHRGDGYKMGTSIRLFLATPTLDTTCPEKARVQRGAVGEPQP